MTDHAIDKVKVTMFDWIGRAMVGLIVFFAYNIYTDVKTLIGIVPVLQDKIETLEKRQDRIDNKIIYGEMKKPDKIAASP